MTTKGNIYLAKKFEAAIKTHPELNDVSISVTIKQGVVTLSGHVAQKKQREKIVECACGLMNVLSGINGHARGIFLFGEAN